MAYQGGGTATPLYTQPAEEHRAQWEIGMPLDCYEQDHMLWTTTYEGHRYVYAFYSYEDEVESTMFYVILEGSGIDQPALRLSNGYYLHQSNTLISELLGIDTLTLGGELTLVDLNVVGGRETARR